MLLSKLKMLSIFCQTKSKTQQLNGGKKKDINKKKRKSKRKIKIMFSKKLTKMLKLQIQEFLEIEKRTIHNKFLIMFKTTVKSLRIKLYNKNNKRVQQ